jgi:hypothetical protein
MWVREEAARDRRVSLLGLEERKLMLAVCAPKSHQLCFLKYGFPGKRSSAYNASESLILF